MPARGVFQGNLSNTGSRVLEMLTSSKAITASHALEAKKLTVGNVGANGIPVYFQNGLPVTDSSAKAVINWVIANSSSIGGSTGSEAATAAAVQGLMQASGSWNSSSAWVGANSASLLSRTSSLSITASLGAPTAVSISYSPNGGNKAINIKIPSNPGHIGAASASHNHTIAQVTGLGSVTDSVKRLESSSSTYVTTASFNSYTSSADGKYLPITGGTINGDLVISNNLTVQGTTVSIDATNLNVKDKLILVASGSTTRAAADGAGIAVPTASAGEGGAARIQYENAGNRFTSSVNFAAPGFTGSLRGDVTGTASYALEADYAVSASRAQEANHAISASEALHAASSTTAANASVAVSASHATTALTASYLIGGASMEVTNAKTASYVAWNNVANKPNYSASFVTGAFAAKIFNPYSDHQTINIPTQPGHVGAAPASHTHSIAQVTGLSAISTSVASMSAHTSSWNNVASTASAAYTAASQALATASVAQGYAESASTYAANASASMQNARTYATNANTALTQANAASSSAKNAATAANTASGSAKNAATAANTASGSAKTAATAAQGWESSASLYASQAQTYRNAASASASVAHTAKTQAEASASAASQSAATAATYATAASASSGVVYQKAQEASASAAAAAGSAATAGSARDAANTASGSAKTSANTATSASTAANNASASAKSAQTAANNASASAKTYATNASASASLLYKNLGSATQPIYLKTTGPELCDPYSSASVKSASYASSSTTASYALIAESVKDGAGLVVNTASFALDHYKPTTATGSAIGTTASRTYIKAINVDKNNHVISVTTGSETVTNTDTKVTAVGNHYTPAQSTGKAASAGSVISGLGLDAKGHVVAVTGSNSITSASFATNAAQLGGKAANQYASASHTHEYATPAQVTGSLGAYLPLAGGTVTGDLTVQGNAIFNGTASFINTTDLVVKDRLILLASGSANTASANGAGIAVQTASATTVAAAEGAAARIQYLSAGNKFTSSVRFEAPQIGATGFTGSLLGTASRAISASRAVSASRADSAASATSATSASHVPFATFVQTNGVYLTASVGNTTKITAINSASRAVSAASADTAATASYNAAGATALAWVTANSSSALTQYHPLSGSLTVALKAGGITSSAEYEVSGAAGKNQYYRVTGNSHSIGFGIGTGNTNRGIYQFATGSGGVGKTGWLLLWDNTYTASFLAGYRVKADGFIGALQGNATSATTATRLVNAGTTGSSRQPVYYNAGKLATCTGYTVTAAQTASWDAKQAAISDLATIRTNAASGNVAFGWGNHANAGYVKSADITTAVNNLVTASGSVWSTDNDTKVTAVGNHYAPTASTEIAASITGSAGTFATNTEYTVLTGIKAKVDARGHITDIKYTAQKVKDTTVANTDRYVATASFASTGSNGANGVKMTLTRRGSDTGTVVATIPVASATAAGVVTGAQVGKIESGSVAFGWGNHANAGYLKSTGTIATASYNAAGATALAWITSNSASALKNDATTYAGHYTPSASGATAKGSSAARTYLKTVSVDGKGHVVGFTTGSETVTNTDTKVTAVGNHYTPAQSAGKSVSAGQVMVGVGVDAAGHVVAVTGSSAITASCLGVAANTSASVAAAIAAKWTYNENTIKGVKVTSASRADSAASATSATKLAGTSGSLGIPVYINAGVPTACNANIVSLPLSSSGATTGTLTLVPGKVHKCGTLTGNLTLALGTDNTYTHEAIYCCKFNMGATLRTITLPSGVKVMENSVALDTVNRDYEINIMDNIAIIARTEE